ncbi:MAG: DEAD/DEAH box helicase [Pirellulales bacterium]|nr:DEAD/DEAH box helicase [Pirellulales bacterium]
MLSRTAGNGATTRRTLNQKKTHSRRKKGHGKVPKKISRQRKPEDMTLDEWQVALRRQFAREQKFRVKNLGGEPLFSEFEVTNPASGRSYRVAIRGSGLGENYCSCPDYAVNTLGTCKHLEFVLDRLGRRPGAKKALALGWQPKFSEVHLQYGAKREVVFKPGTECPAALKRFARLYFDEQSYLKPEAFPQFHKFLQKIGDGAQEVRCYDDALAFIAQVRDRFHLQEQVAQAFPRGIRSAAWKGLLRTRMYPYQCEGALFAARAGRCLIADDMGLGKTIQAIAAVEILARHAGIERVLVVSPTSLKHQWRQEIEKFSGRPAVVVEGFLNRRRQLYETDSFYKLTNYDVIHRDLDSIRRWQPDLVILDEAQRIKNWQTRTAQSVKKLESKYAIVLTGTPLENRLEELHSIVEFVDRHRLGPMFRFLDRHQHVDDHGRVTGYRDLDHISQTLEPILIRRTKDKVLKELPERLEKRFFVPMTEEQMEFHEENRETVARIVAKWRRFGFLSEDDQLRLRIALQNMRMSCNSTYLLDKKTDHGLKSEELVALLAEIFEDPLAKVVIFSQWVRMHELITWRLEKRKWRHVLFHGGVPGPQRKNLIQQFKEDPQCRLFLSTDAGGVGLNLQHASAVVNLDLPWNPAVLEQRIGRVHRLGQHRPVRVVHFIAQGTIEEGMLGLLAFKKSLFAGVLDGGQSEVFLGGTKLKRFMESVEKATGSIPESMPTAEEPDAEEEKTPGRVGQAKRSPTKSQEKSTSAQEEPSLRPASPEQTWSDVFSAGFSFLEKIQRALQGGPGSSQQRPSGRSGPLKKESPTTSLIEQDPATGRGYLKLPLPEPQVMEKLLGLLQQFGK